MNEDLAPGLPADWLNAWLAAIGITILVPSVHLSWTNEPIPVARISHPEASALSALVGAALPVASQLETLSIHEIPRQVTLPEYRKRVTKARQGGVSWQVGDFSLSSSMTDLMHDPKWKDEAEKLPHGPFDPAAPGTTGSVYHRLLKCLHELERIAPETCQAVSASLSGRGKRVDANGLGFDHRRLVSGVLSKATVQVDPVVECLCYFGLALFPVRGNGRRERTRGWIESASKLGAFSWPVWERPLDVWGIDALLDRFYDRPRDGKTLGRFGVRGSFRSVPYQRMADADPTRGYASERAPWT